MAAQNPWEREARRLKVAKLAAHITELVSWLGLDPKTDGYFISELIREWGDPEWNSAAVNIGKKPDGNKPLVGVDTRLAVLAHFVESGRKAQQVSA